MIRILTAAALAMLMPATQAMAAPHPRPVMIGYLASFKDMKGTLAATDLAKLTHINLAFVNPGPDSSIVTGDLMTCMQDRLKAPIPAQDVRDIVTMAHKAHVKVLASLGGGQIPLCSGDWATLLQPANRPKLVASLTRFVDDYDLDGLDIDLEWAVLTRIDTDGNYTPFASELHDALKARGKLLTCATASHPGGMIPQASIVSFDYVNIMSYDFIGTDWGAPGSEHASFEQARDDIAVWQARGLPKSKLVLGVPFFGYGFNGYARGYAYKDILAQFGPMAAYGDTVGKPCAGCQYVTYNGRATIRAKAGLAAETGAGLMIWELSEDAQGADSLLDAADDSLNHAAGSDPSPR